jgi:hypothetical protein
VAPPFLTSTLDRGEWSASRPGRFTPGERALDTHYMGGLVGTRSGLDDVEKRKIFTGNRTPFFQPVARRFTDWVIRTPDISLNIQKERANTSCRITCLPFRDLNRAPHSVVDWRKLTMFLDISVVIMTFLNILWTTRHDMCSFHLIFFERKNNACSEHTSIVYHRYQCFLSKTAVLNATRKAIGKDINLTDQTKDQSGCFRHANFLCYISVWCLKASQSLINYNKTKAIMLLGR